MQLRTRNFALFLSGFTLIGAAVFAAACSSETETTDLPTPDSGRSDTGTANGEAGTNPRQDGGGGDADCSRAPTLHDNSDGFYCPYTGDSGDNRGPCTEGQTCCNPNKVGDSYPRSFCTNGTNGEVDCAAEAEDFGASWDAGGSAWECADDSQCAGDKCCAIKREGATSEINFNKPPKDANIPAACNALTGYQIGGTRCRTTCDTGEVQMCSINSDVCMDGKICTPFYVLGRDLAYCR